MPTPGNPAPNTLAVADAQRDLDYLVGSVCKKFDAIVSAHVELGIPIEDLICSAVHKAARRSASDDHQPSLFTGEVI